MRKVVIVGVFVVGIAIGLLGVAVSLLGSPSSRAVQLLRSTTGASSESAQSIAPAVPAPIATGPITLWDAYAKNEVGADNQFLHKRLKMIGLIAGIRKDAVQTIVIDIAAHPDETNSFRRLTGRTSIEARFSDEWAREVGTLERGQVIEIECTGRGLVMGTPELADCALKWRQPSDVPAFAALLAPSYELCLVEKTPGFADALISDTYPDGGPLDAKTRKARSTYRRLIADDRAALAKARAEQLPCNDTSITLLSGCDGESPKTYPQCGSELVRLAMGYLHH